MLKGLYSYLSRPPLERHLAIVNERFTGPLAARNEPVQALAKTIESAPEALSKDVKTAPDDDLIEFSEDDNEGSGKKSGMAQGSTGPPETEKSPSGASKKMQEAVKKAPETEVSASGKKHQLDSVKPASVSAKAPLETSKLCCDGGTIPPKASLDSFEVVDMPVEATSDAPRDDWVEVALDTDDHEWMMA